MSKTHFCVNCGESISFHLERPKFCPSCGSPQSATVANRAASQSQAEEPETFSGNIEVEKIIRSLAGRVEPIQTVKIGAIYGTAQEGEEEFARPALTKEQCEKEIARRRQRHTQLDLGMNDESED